MRKRINSCGGTPAANMGVWSAEIRRGRVCCPARTDDKKCKSMLRGDALGVGEVTTGWGRERERERAAVNSIHFQYIRGRESSPSRRFMQETGKERESHTESRIHSAKVFIQFTSIEREESGRGARAPLGMGSFKRSVRSPTERERALSSRMSFFFFFPFFSFSLC